MPVTQAEIEAAARAHCTLHPFYDQDLKRYAVWEEIDEEDRAAHREAASIILEAAERARWQPIETAKKDDSFVLVHVPNGGIETGPVTIGTFMRIEDRDEKGRFARKKFWPADWTGWLGVDADNSPSCCEPTHWQPLPSPPEST